MSIYWDSKESIALALLEWSQLFMLVIIIKTLDIYKCLREQLQKSKVNIVW